MVYQLSTSGDLTMWYISSLHLVSYVASALDISWADYAVHQPTPSAGLTMAFIISLHLLC